MSALCPLAPAPIILCPIPSRENPLLTAFGGLGDGLKNRDFWLLAGTFFVCGFTTNGLVGTHMIALCGDHGMDAVAAGGLLAMMGFCRSDRHHRQRLADRPGRSAQIAVRLLRAARAVADLSALRQFHLSRPVLFRGVSMAWTGSPPCRPPWRWPTGCSAEKRAPVIFGWIYASHQVGAASAAFLAGLSRSASGSYLEAFIVAGLCRRRRPPLWP